MSPAHLGQVGKMLTASHVGTGLAVLGLMTLVTKGFKVSMSLNRVKRIWVEVVAFLQR